MIVRVLIIMHVISACNLSFRFLKKMVAHFPKNSIQKIVLHNFCISISLNRENEIFARYQQCLYEKENRWYIKLWTLTDHSNAPLVINCKIISLSFNGVKLCLVINSRGHRRDCILYFMEECLSFISSRDNVSFAR